MNVPPLAPGREPWRLPEQGVTYVVDLETDGLLDVARTIHAVVVRDFRSGDLVVSLGGPAGVRAEEIGQALETADALVAHNGYRFDYPILERLAGWTPRPGQLLLDTLPLSRLIYSHLGDRKHPDPRDIDAPLVKSGQLPQNLYGSHGMEAWGYRLGYQKVGADIADWSVWTPLMQERCESDSAVNLRLLQLLASKPFSSDAVELELGVARLCAKLELTGFPFDTQLAEKVTGELCVSRAQLEAQIRSELCGWWKAAEKVTPPKSRRSFAEHPEGAVVNRGTRKTPKLVPGWNWEYTEGAEFTPVEWNVLNPSSGPQVVEYLGRLRNWQPEEYTPKGHAKVDEKTLGKLPWPEARLLCKYLTVRKRLGQIAEGNKAWLKVVNNGRIHGGINPNGAVTGRATHSEPNLAQVPRINLDKEGNVLHGEAGGWGWECRSMFRAPPGMVLVGADLSKLELLCLAHYLSAYDSGAYAEVVLSGDPHVYMQQQAGVDTRAKGKTLNYAFLYGAGDEKLGSTAEPHASAQEKRRLGRALRARVLSNFRALGNLTQALAPKAEQGWLYGLDGRHIPVRHKHAVVNTLLQGAGAAVAKAWMVELKRGMAATGIPLGRDWHLLAWVHDEVQFAVHPEDAEEAQRIAVGSAAAAGRFLKMRVPILAEAKSGPHWASTH